MSGPAGTDHAADLAADIDLLTRMADTADAIALPSWQTGDFEVEIKSDESPVTTTDPAVEQALLALVREHRPDDGFLGEEVGAHPGSNDRTWIVDGIDGTSRFVADRPHWSTLVALTVDEVPIAGAVTSPALGRRWTTTGPSSGLATPTHGSSGATVAFGVTSTQRLDGARIATFPGFDRVRPEVRPQAERLAAAIDRWAGSSSFVGHLVPHGSVAIAEGQLDAMVAFGGQPWDLAAPAAVVTAAGGRFTDLDGGTSLHTRTAVYSNGRIHDDLLAILNVVGSGEDP